MCQKDVRYILLRLFLKWGQDVRLKIFFGGLKYFIRHTSSSAFLKMNASARHCVTSDCHPSVTFLTKNLLFIDLTHLLTLTKKKLKTLFSILTSIDIHETIL